MCVSVRYPVEGTLVVVEGIVAFQRAPRQFRDILYGRHVDTMLSATAHLHEGVFTVAEADRNHVIVHIDIDVLLGKTQEGRSAVHIAHYAAGVGRAVHEYLAGAHQKVQTSVQLVREARFRGLSLCGRRATSLFNVIHKICRNDSFLLIFSL